MTEYKMPSVKKVSVPHENTLWEYPIMAGEVKKMGGFIHWYKKKYFVLTKEGQLFYFRNKKNKKAQNQKKPVTISERFFRRTDKKLNTIKIERYPKHIYFQLKDSSEMLKWLEMLALAGGIKKEKEVTKKKKKKKEGDPEIALKELNRWNQKNVLQWLGFNSLGKEQFSIYAENFAQKKGSDLEAMTEDDLVKMGIDNLPHRKKIMRAIKGIRDSRTFNYKEHSVYQKIERMTKNFGKCKNANWKFLARSLSAVECMKETYLNPSIVQDAFDKYIPEDEEAIDEDEDSDEDIELVPDDDTAEKPEEMTVSLKKTKQLKLPVKLVVTEMVHSDGYKSARRLLSPIINRLPKLKKEFGIFHTALIVGPWYIEWTDSSLVIPRKLYSGMALVSADIDTTTLIKNMTIDEIATKLSEVICRWNTTMAYCNINVNDNPYLGNCQEFVEDCMEALQISLNKDGAFGRFLEQMKVNGKCEMIFSPSKKYKEVFKLKLRNYTFESHRDLDEFVTACSKIDEIAIQMDFKEEYKLLKSFDRAFWLRHFKKPNIDRFKPSGKCPFEDPRKTKSYMTYS